MDMPLWRVSYRTHADNPHGQVEIKTWTEVWATHVRPTFAEVQGYWTYLSDYPVCVTDFMCEAIIRTPLSRIAVMV